VPPDGAKAQDAIAGTDPFIMQGDGRAWLFAPAGLVDGPLPTHYEPAESPVENAFYKQQANPTVERIEGPWNRANPTASEVYPFAITTYRLTEHHTAGGMSRWLSHLAELQPEFFAEISPELATSVGAQHGEWVTIASPRGVVEARALVTSRMPSLQIDGRLIHQVGLPYHWGTKGLVTGDSANDLIAMSQEPNVRIMETKGLVCHIAPGRRPRGPEALAYLERLMRGHDGISH
jgi:formate dehydrogenase major subunit